MDIYNTVNKLAQELKQSEEYMNFKMAKQALGMMPEYQSKILEFEKLRHEEQINTFESGKIDEKQMRDIQNLYAELIEFPEIKKYFDAELKFNILLGNINKIISESVVDVIS